MSKVQQVSQEAKDELECQENSGLEEIRECRGRPEMTDWWETLETGVHLDCWEDLVTKEQLGIWENPGLEFLVNKFLV